jgi:putative ATP-dependent endonuclease of OLD family
LKLVSDEEKQQQYAREVNDQIRALPRWKQLLSDGKKKINKHLSEVTLRESPQTVDVDFVETEFRKIVEGLKIHLPVCQRDENAEDKERLQTQGMGTFEIWQNGLGYNNLIYAATVFGDLLERRNREPSSFIALLIEEPEAHLHPQLQNVFFSYLKAIEEQEQGIQVFVTSHSPTITAKTDIDSLIALTVLPNSLFALPLRKVGLEKAHKKYLQRFLDVTKCQLFFSRGVILVEGISEALLLPCFAKLMGEDYNIERKGVEIVNIGGVAFAPFAKLFNSEEQDERLEVRCAILTDDDRSSSEADISNRAKKAREFEKGMVRTFFAEHTFESELYLANETLVTKTYSELHPRTDLKFQGDSRQKAYQFVEMIKTNKDKAEFAQLLAVKMEADKFSQGFVVPQYIQNAIRWVIEGNVQTAN